MSDARNRFALRLDEAGLSVARFIDVNNGEKGTYDHTQRMPDTPALSGNYGIYGGRGAQHIEECIDVPRNEWSDTEYVWDCDCTCGGDVLVDVDVDDGQAFVESGAIDHAPSTFRVKSPHAGLGDTATEDDVEGHHFYRVPGTVADIEGAINELMTGDSVNPAPSWGEVRVFNQFVVGPGSEITDCDKDWHDCSPSDEGHYRIADDHPIETLTPDDLVSLLCASGDYAETTPTPTETTTATEEAAVETDDIEMPDETGTDPSTVLNANPWIGEYLALGGADDRSAKDFAVCRTLIENGVSESEAYELLNSSTHTKVNERGQNYWRSTWQKALQKVAESETVPTESGDDDGIPKPEPSAGFECRNDHYGYTKELRSGETVWEEVTNFQLEAESFLVESDGEDSVELTVHPARHGQSYTTTVPMTTFNEVRDFRKRVVTSRGTAYSGGMDMLNKIRKFVGSQDAPVRTGVDHIGFHIAEDTAEWVTPNGALSADGWRDDPDAIFYDDDSPLSDKLTLSPEDGDNYDTETVQEILRLLPRTRKIERGLPALAWFYAATLRPLIHDWEGEFNILNVLGNTGAGKTATLEALWECFGADGSLLRADGTPFPILKALCSSNAFPTVLDEYKPEEMSQRQLHKLHANLRHSARGVTDSKGRPDGSTYSNDFSAPVCVAGEQPIKGSALERRTILTAFTRSVTKEDSPQSRAFTRLVGGELDGDYLEGHDLHEHARAYFPWMLAQDRYELLQAWRAAGDAVSEILNDLDVTGLDDLVFQGYQTVAFGMMIYRRFAEEMGVNVAALPVGESDVADAIAYLTDEGTGAEHHSNVDRLVGMIGRAAAADYLERDEHYTFVHKDTPNAELCVQMNTAFDKVRKYARDHDIGTEDLLGSVSDYHSRFRDEQERDDSYIITSSKPAKPIGRACAFHFERLLETVEGAERQMFTNVADADNDGMATIENLTPGEYVTIEAMASSVLEPRPWLRGEGTLRDDTGRIDYVIRGAIGGEIEQGTMHRLTDVKVTTDDDGMTCLEIRGGTTGVEAIGPTASEQGSVTETAETDGGESAQQAEADATPPADARGAAPDAMRLSVLIDDVFGGQMQREELHNAAKARHDLDEAATEMAIEYALRNGILLEPETNLIRTA